MTPIARPRGSTLQTLRRLANDPLGALVELQQEHGDLWLLDLPFLPTVFVSSPEHIHTVLVKDVRSYRKDFQTRQLSRILGDGLLLSEGETWRRHRRLAQPAFHAEALRSYAATMSEAARTTAESWGPRRELDLHAEMMRLTLNIVARTLFGHDLGDDAAVISHSLDTFMETYRGVGNTGVLLPRWLPTAQNRRQSEALAQVDRVVYRMVETHRHNPDPHTLLGMLLAAADEQGGLSDQQLRDEAVTLLMAGHETTAVALTMALYLLSQHPNVERRLQAEVDSVLGSPAQSLGVEDLHRLPYCRAVLWEAMRLYPPVWSFGRESLVDTTLGEHPVPAGVHLWLAPWLTQRDSRWFDDPLSFRPERWDTSSTPRLRSEAPLPDGAFFPFGAGPRVCIGKRFAELEAVLVLAHIVRRCALRLAPGEALRLFPSITLRPEHGLSMIATEREPLRHAA
jgi:cytochrome P450